MHGWVLVASFPFTNNINTIFSHSNFPSTEMNESVLKDTLELLVHQYCHLSVTNNDRGITFHSTLIC